MAPFLIAKTLFLAAALAPFLTAISTFRESHQFIREVFVKDEAKDVVLVFIGLDLRTHLVGRFPDFGSELLFVHSGDVFEFN